MKETIIEWGGYTVVGLGVFLSVVIGHKLLFESRNGSIDSFQDAKVQSGRRAGVNSKPIPPVPFKEAFLETAYKIKGSLFKDNDGVKNQVFLFYNPG